MAVENQTLEMFAGNRRVLRWPSIFESDGVTLLNLSGRIVKFTLARKNADGVPLINSPILSFSSADASPQATIPNPVLGSSHVEVVLLPIDTVTLAPKETEYHCQLEVFEGDGSGQVVVATMDITIKPNIVETT